MTPKPFTPNTSKKNKKLIQAKEQVYAAIAALIEAQNTAENWSEYETIGDFKKQLKEFMSCDHGEAGFEIYVAKKVGSK